MAGRWASACKPLLSRESGRSARLRWHASDAIAASAQGDWRELFREIDAKPEEVTS